VVQPDAAVAADTVALAKPPESVPQQLAELAPEHWVTLVTTLGLAGMTDSLARALSLEQVTAGTLCFHYTAEQDAMLNETQRGRIADALGQRFGAGISVEFREAPQTRETPAQYAERRRRERKAEAVMALRNDPLVQQIIEQFGAHIEEESVIPIDPS
jgi:DNA polymerase-3 subunit gamma/tau